MNISDLTNILGGDIKNFANSVLNDVSNNINNTNPQNNSDNSSIEFIEPKNPLDPIVVFDPEFEFSNVVFPYNYDDVSEVGQNKDTTSTLKVNGVNVPILKVNNKIIMPKNVYALTIYLKEFLPTIILKIDDPKKNIQATDVPGMNNTITVIITAPVNGANKKISMDFYITDCKFNEDDTITYYGEYKCNDLKQIKYTQIGDSELTTYEMLENIAKDCKLGFAATDKCKEISDKKWRQLYSETYKDYIIQQLQYAGVDENSIFDVWIDNFGYLVLVNLSYIMGEEIDLRQLSIKVIEGNTITDLPENKVPEQNIEEVYRIITNSKETSGNYNLRIEEYFSIVNNNDILNKGTLNRYYYLDSPCDQNLIKQEQIQVFENSVDGLQGLEDYKYENIEFIGTNQLEGDVCELYQGEIIKNYFNKLNAKILKVKLPIANYTLQRGMILQVIIEEYEINNKQSIIDNFSNASTVQDDEQEIYASDENYKDRSNIVDDYNGVINPSLSGLYYINGMELEYNAGDQKFEQTLYLIKKGLTNNLLNKYTSVKLPPQK